MMQTATLWQGWWSLISFFAFAWVTLGLNLAARRKLLALAPPTGESGRQLPTGPPIHKRPAAYIALLPIGWACNLLVQLVMHL